MLPQKLQHKIENRINSDSFRQLGSENELIDFCSNDYLGFSKSLNIFDEAHHFLIENNLKINGATGSRLLSGNYNLYNELETYLSEIHKAESALVFNSGYTANLGLLSSILVKGSLIIYDELVHASIRDGIKLSDAKAYKYEHNNHTDLEKKLLKFKKEYSDIYIITESVFSMDGDSPKLEELVALSKKHNANLIVDEAHAIGVHGLGLVQELQLENDVFARVITFGKAMGCHGAVILCSVALKNYLVNFSRTFIYTTGMPPHQLATILSAYKNLKNEYGKENRAALTENIALFKSELKNYQIETIPSNSAIHCCIIGGNTETKKVATQLQNNGYNAKAILHPTVEKGKERIRLCIHSYNTSTEIKDLTALINNILKK